MKFRDKIKSKVKAVSNLNEIILPKSLPQYSTFDQSHFQISFLNADSRTQLSAIKVVANWLEGYGVNTKGEQTELKMICKWYRRTKTNIEEIKNFSNTHQMSLDDVGMTVQVQCMPEADGIDYQGMPIIQMIGPIILDPETLSETNQLITAQKATFCVYFNQLNIQSVEEDQTTVTEGRIMIYDNHLLQISGLKKGEKGSQLLCEEEFVSGCSYPEVVNVADNGKMVSLLINERNDFVSVEFENHKVRDVFCVLISKLKELSRSKIEQMSQGKLEKREQKDEVKAGQDQEREYTEKDEVKQMTGEEEVGQRENGSVVKQKLGNLLTFESSFDSRIKVVPEQIGQAEAEQYKVSDSQVQIESIPNQQISQGQQASPAGVQGLDFIPMGSDFQQTEKHKTSEQLYNQPLSSELQNLLEKAQEKTQQQHVNKVELGQIQGAQNVEHNLQISIVEQKVNQFPQPQAECQQIQETGTSKQRQKTSKEQQIVNELSQNSQRQQVEQKQNQQKKILHQQTGVPFTAPLVQSTLTQDTSEVIYGQLQTQMNYEEKQQQPVHQQEYKPNETEQIAPQVLDRARLSIRQELMSVLNQQFNVKLANKQQQLKKRQQELKKQLQSKYKLQYEQKLKQQMKKKQTQLRLSLHKQLQAQLKPKLRAQAQKQLRTIIRGQLLPQLKTQCIKHFTPILRQQAIDQLTPLLTSQLTAKLKQQLTPKIKLQLIPTIKDELTPKIIEQLTPKIREQLLPKIRQQLIPSITQDITPKIKEELIPIIKSQITPQIKSELTPKIKQELTPQIRSELTPQIKEDLTPKIKQELTPKIREELTLKIKQELTPKIKQQLTPKLKNELSPKIRHQLEAQLKPILKNQLILQKQAKLSSESLAYEQIVTATPAVHKIEPQELVYYKNELKLLHQENQQLTAQGKTLTQRVSELEDQIKRYRPNTNSNNSSSISNSSKSPPAANDPNVGNPTQTNTNQTQSKHINPTNQPSTLPTLSQIQPLQPSQQQQGTSQKHQQITPYQQLQQQLQQSHQENKLLLSKQQILLSEKQSLQEELMKYKVELEELQAHKKHLDKKYQSLFSELQNNSTTITTHSNLNHLFNTHHQVHTLSHNSSFTSSPVKSNKELNSLKSITSPRPEPISQSDSPISKFPPHNTNIKTSFSTNKKSFTQSRFTQSPYPTTAEYPTTDYQKMSQAIINHYSSEQELAKLKKQLLELTQQNTGLRSILQKDKKSSLPLIGSSTSSKQLKLQIMELKKLANRLAEEVTDKNQAIDNMKSINKELNNRLCEVTKEFHLHKMAQLSSSP